MRNVPDVICNMGLGNFTSNTKSVGLNAFTVLTLSSV